VTQSAPPTGTAPIARVRAAFVGALAGGVLWAVAFKVFGVLGDHTATSWRIVGPIAIVWVPVAVIGSVAYRFSSPPRRRTSLAAALIALCSGVLLPAM